MATVARLPTGLRWHALWFKSEKFITKKALFQCLTNSVTNSVSLISQWFWVFINRQSRVMLHIWKMVRDSSCYSINLPCVSMSGISKLWKWKFKKAIYGRVYLEILHKTKLLVLICLYLHPDLTLTSLMRGLTSGLAFICFYSRP